MQLVEQVSLLFILNSSTLLFTPAKMPSLVEYFSVFLSKFSLSGLGVGTYLSKFNPKSYTLFRRSNGNSKDKAASATCLSRVRSRLFTHEDNTNVHKILGLLALWHFIYRYYLVFSEEGNLGFNNSKFDWVTMALHMALSSSSLIFKVLRKRRKDQPMMIYEEYRLHAVVFTLRCIMVFAFAMWRPFEQYGETVEAAALYFTVMFNHVLADLVTKKFGTPGNTAVRVRTDNKGDRPWHITFGMRFYSFYQFMALGSHLVLTPRLGDLGFNALIAIQSSAFLMTLFRKNLIKWYTHALWYGICLFLSTFQILYLAPSAPLFIARTLVAFLLRIKLRWNKYVIWALYAGTALITLEQVKEFGGKFVELDVFQGRVMEVFS